MGKKISHNEYKEMLYNHNSNLELLSEFDGFSKKVKVRDSLGIEYYVNAKSILDNLSPHISCAINKTDAFNKKLHKIFPNLNLYKEYTKGNIKTEIIDDLGIIYFLKPESLLQGRYPSILSAIDKNDAIVKKAREVHGNLYDYSRVEYIGDKIKIEIICPEHGSFWQRPNNHINQKAGCPECNKARGWSKSDWLAFSKEKQCIFYIIECYSEKEHFIKAGITSTTIEKRFQSIREMPYNYNIILKLNCSAEESWNYEQDHSKKYKEHRYIPEIDFKGKTECYNINILKELINE